MRAALVKEAADNAVGISQILGAARVAETPGAAPIVKEAAGNVVEASYIVGTAKVGETLGAAKVAARITGEGANKPEQLNQIFELEEAAQIHV